MTHTRSINQRAFKVIAGELAMPESQVDASATFEEVGVDSLDKMSMVIAMEQEFNIDIPDEVVGEWQKLGDMIEWINGSVKIN